MARTNALPAPDSVSKHLWALAKRPPGEPPKLWKGLAPERRRELLCYFLDNASPDNRTDYLTSAAEYMGGGFRAAKLAEMDADKVADLLEKRGFAARSTLTLLYFWLRSEKDPLFDLFIDSIDADYVDGDNTVELDNGLTIEASALPTAAGRVLAAGDVESGLLFLLTFYVMEPPMRAALKPFFHELTTRPFDAFMEEVNAEYGDWLEEVEDREGPFQGVWDEDDDTVHFYTHVATPEDAGAALDDLTDRFAMTADALREMADDLEHGTLPPPSRLAGRVVEVGVRYAELEERIRTLMGEVRDEDGEGPEARQLDDLGALIERWDTLEDEVDRLRAAQSVLLSLLFVRHSELGHDFEPLTALHEDVADLLRRVSDEEADTVDDVEALAARSHPYTQLLDIVSDPEVSQGTGASRLGAEISAAVGSELAFAALLGHLEIHEIDDIRAILEGALAGDVEIDALPDHLLDALRQRAPHEADIHDSVEEPDAAPADEAKSESEAPTDGGLDEGAEEEAPDATATVQESPATEGPEAGEKQAEADAGDVEEVEDDAAEAPEAAEDAPAGPDEAVAPGPPEAEDVAPVVETEEPAGDPVPEPEPGLSPAEQVRPLPAPRVAEAALRRANGERAALTEVLAAKLIGDDRRALAAHLTRWSSEALGPAAHIPAWLPHALALAPHITSGMGEIFVSLRNDLAQFDAGTFETGDDTWDQGLALLLTAATLRPSLLAPTTLAPHVLNSVSFKEGLPHLWEYCQFVADHTMSGAAIDPSIIKRVQDQAEWEQSLADLQERAADWVNRAARTTMSYQAATLVWQAWLNEGATVYELLRPVRRNNTKRKAFVRSEIARLSDPQNIRRLVDDTDRKVLDRHRGKPIIAKAYQKLQHKLAEAVDLAREWVELTDVAPGEEQTYRIEQADRIRREAMTRHDQIRGELDALDRDDAAPIVAAGIGAVRSALSDVEEVFDAETEPSRDEPPSLRVLNGPLLRTDSLTLDLSWRLDGEDPARVAEQVLELAAHDPPEPWLAALEHRTDIGDHVGTDLILRLAEAGVVDIEGPVDGLRRKRQQRMSEARAQIERHVASVQADVERGVMHGLLREADRVRLIGRTHRVEEALDEELAFHRLRAELEDVADEVAERRTERIQAVRDRLGEADLEADSEAYQRIDEALGHGDALTANEYLHHVERGIPLPPRDDTEPSAFETFFPGRLEQLEQWSMPNAAQVVRMVRARETIPGINLAPVAKAQTELAADTLNSWFRARGRRGRPNLEEVEAIFSFLGFNVLGVRVPDGGSEGSSRVWLDLTSEPVRDRSRCPVARFGSSAAGDFSSERAHYRVLLVWDEPTPEDLMGAVGETAQSAPTYVLYFGRMGADRRRSLARLCREMRRTFLVLDEYLLLYLSGERRARMPTFFACTLPFTFLEPYVTTASVVPPEIFFGREEERESVMDPHGSCFIYGGRQLGKTALLRHVERRFHDPAHERYAIYVDLKVAGIAFNLPVDDFWQLLSDRLKGLGILDAGVAAHANPEKILDEVRAWLDNEPQRRLLLLLDEADRFLEADKEFTRVARLKGLMDSTDRRFKVVFAGLHNVQRSTRLANNPLAHLGEPLCIGPLFEDGEWRQARDLVRRPLEAIGYRFESQDLVTRILSQTNYYPSLLQLYCTQLLRHVNRPNIEVLDSRQGPPYTLSTRNVEDAYQSQELWQWIRQRFVWTLQLDLRYQLIALLIAHQTTVDEEAARRGFSVSDVRRMALNWWPEGFSDERSEDTFRVLLEEMVGLGILRESDAATYALRSGNVRLLMGTPDEIEDSLLTLSEKEAPRGYEPTTFRRPLPAAGKGDGPTRYSPLTAQQESELLQRENGVSVLFGVDAAGLDSLDTLLPTVFGEDYTVRIEALDSLDTFEEALQQTRDRKRDGVTLFAVTESCAWGLEWVDAALAKTAALRSKSSFARFLFVADPVRTWELVARNAHLTTLLENPAVTTFTLRPWHDLAVRALLDDLKVPASLLDEHLASIKELTGKWPALLYELERRLQSVSASQWERAFEEFERTWQPGSDRLAPRLEAFGLDRPGPPARNALAVLGAVEVASAEDLEALAETDGPDVRRALLWADRLALAHRAGNDVWEMDPIVARLLTAKREHDTALVDTSGA